MPKGKNSSKKPHTRKDTMGVEIVKYHNDLNRIKLPDFTAQEQNLLFTILAKIKNKKQENNEPIRLFMKDIVIGKIESREVFTESMESLKNKFFKASFRQIIETETEIIDSHFHLFNKMDIHYTKKDPNDGYDDSKIFYHIDLEVNQRFEYLIKELTSNFTTFELLEFINLNSKYTKTLYRLLKQYRSTGIMKMKWNEFESIMDIPRNTYNMCDIDKRILKPAIKELTKERTLFDKNRVAFQNLQYEKIKEKGFRGRGQGGKVVGIQFTFTPEVTQSKTTIEQQTTQTQSNHSIQQNNTGNYAITPKTNGKDEKEVIKEYDTRYRHTKVNYNGEILVIKSVSQGNNGGLSVHFKEFEKGTDKGNIHFNSVDDLAFFIQDNQ